MWLNNCKCIFTLAHILDPITGIYSGLIWGKWVQNIFPILGQDNWAEVWTLLWIKPSVKWDEKLKKKKKKQLRILFLISTLYFYGFPCLKIDKLTEFPSGFKKDTMKAVIRASRHAAMEQMCSTFGYLFCLYLFNTD